MSKVTQRTIRKQAAELCARDADLKRVVDQYGIPPLWSRPTGFATLVLIILEQQVSLASARAAYAKLEAVINEVTPHALLALDDAQLRAIGFSRQKTLYCRELARAVLNGALDLDALNTMDDATVRETLTQIKGIGNWTADIYLLMCLSRPDILPKGDIALYAALKDIKRLPQRPTYEEFAQYAEMWRPYRAVAARILWHHYLSVKKK
jgi:DNA-3-methyladenine glycosylase II